MLGCQATWNTHKAESRETVALCVCACMCACAHTVVNVHKRKRTRKIEEENIILVIAKGQQLI